MKFWVGLLGVVVVLAACTTDNGDVAVSAERDVETPRVHDAQGEEHIERRSTTEASTTDAAETDVFLDVSNQSFFDPDVHITIRDESEAYVDASFPVEGQHHFVGYQLSLGVGTHRLTGTSDSGAIEELIIDVRDDGPRYVFITYWADEGTPPRFNSGQSAQPFGYG